jgi:hypothetical protein
MEMQPQPVARRPWIDSRVILWALVALYTFLLPDVIIAYRAIVASFGKIIAGEVPVYMVVTVGLAYAAALLLSHRNWKNLLFLVPSGIIAVLIIKLVDNPNKHVHIPEYVLMAWLLFAVLSKDHKGKGLLILVFVYASMLGVVDELEQGIHPARFYGAPDMLVNSASALIGVFTIMGLKNITATDWSWTSRLIDYKLLLWLDLFGFAGAVIMCVYLFRVAASGSFWGVYPLWLWIWNFLYLIMAPVILALHRIILRRHPQSTESGKVAVLPPEGMTARLWIFPLLVILFYMQALALYVSISGVKFV